MHMLRVSFDECSAIKIFLEVVKNHCSHVDNYIIASVCVRSQLQQLYQVILCTN
jgi:hypothetical protein